MAGRANLDEEVLLDLVGSLLVGLALGAGLYQSVQVKSQVTDLVTQILTSLSPASGQAYYLFIIKKVIARMLH